MPHWLSDDEYIVVTRDFWFNLSTGPRILTLSFTSDAGTLERLIQIVSIRWQNEKSEFLVRREHLM